MSDLDLWPRPPEAPVRFGVRSLRRATLDEVRTELETALGLRFVPEMNEGDPAFSCVRPACEVRLNPWSSEVPGMCVFNFIASPPDSPDDSLPSGENISEALAARLRGAGRDWYVPDKNEFREEAGLLGDRILEAGVLISLLSPPWLSSLSGEEREVGATLLEKLATAWISAARRTSDPVGDVKRRKTELLRQFAEPSARLRILASHALHDELSS